MENKNNKLSVIVPVYNTEDFLPECIEHLINQTYKNIEIILVDDGSNDNSLSICEEFKKIDSRIIVIKKKSEGAASARKAGIEVATGEFVTFCDSDDWIENIAFEEMMNEALTSQTEIVIASSMYIDRKNTELEIFRSEIENKVYIGEDIESVRLNIFKIKPSLYSKIFKYENIKKHILAVDNHIIVGNDMSASYPAILNANSVSIISKCFYHYKIGYRKTYLREPENVLQSYGHSYRLLLNSVINNMPSVKQELDMRYTEFFIKNLLNICNNKKEKISVRLNKLYNTWVEFNENDIFKTFSVDTIRGFKEENCSFIWRNFVKKNFFRLLLVVRIKSKFKKLRESYFETNQEGLK